MASFYIDQKSQHNPEKENKEKCILSPISCSFETNTKLVESLNYMPYDLSIIFTKKCSDSCVSKHAAKCNH